MARWKIRKVTGEYINQRGAPKMILECGHEVYKRWHDESTVEKIKLVGRLMRGEPERRRCYQCGRDERKEG